jgi:hypothetical protein
MDNIKKQKPKYDAIVFDFDNTLCNINIFTSGIKMCDINETDKTIKINDSYKAINTFFNDYAELSIIFLDLKCKGVKLIIASFGNLEIIRKITDLAFPLMFDYILTSDNIDEEAKSGTVMKFMRHIVDITCPRFYGKNIMIKTIIDKYNITDPSKILLFDDDYSNTVCSSSMKIDSYNNPIHGINSRLLIRHIYNQSGGMRYIKFI